MDIEKILKYANTKLPDPATFENNQIKILVPKGDLLEYFICTFYKKEVGVSDGKNITIWVLSYIE